jgi:hypothetical protein
MTDRGIALGLLMTAGIGVTALLFGRTREQRLVQTWQKNSDGSCTFFYDDGSEETAVCTDPPV